ncbi:MFS transporter [Streptomyces coeruleorubidus]|uniref:MFS transporter n=1 Tax=Streptomyces coeruleorubidus TaxID=116188 RepID=UPI00237FC5B2|nr:MFS transporter [Streptomyces coeruleorubidus]WDV53928.1 MFS transporter [Streptomyces coeruleorubidus]
MVNSQTTLSRWLLPVLLTVQFLVSLDISVVNVALPDIDSGLHFDPGSLAWVVNAYALTFGGLLLLGGRLADVAGRRRVLVAGFVVFGVASLLGGLAQTPGQLIAARAAQGVGAAALAPVALALITVNYPQGAPRSRALGLWGAAGAAGGAVGVLVGGLLTDWTGWRSVMLVNVPVVAAALAVVRPAVPADDRSAGGPRPRLDVVGALLATAGTALLVLELVRTESHGWTSWQTAGVLAAAVVLLAAFAVTQTRVRQPLLRFGLLRSGPVLAANVFALLMSAGQFAAFYFTSLYMQQVLGYGPTAAGSAFLPFCVGVVAGSVIATRTVGRVGPGALLVAGGLLGAAGFAWFAAAVAVDGGFLLTVLGPSAVSSVGTGLCFVPLGTAATTGVPAADTGMASGLLNSSRQVGGAVGLAVLVTVAAQAGGTGARGLVDGFAAAYWVSAGLLAVAAVAAGLLSGRRPLPAETSAGKKSSKKSVAGVDPDVSRSTQG